MKPKSDTGRRSKSSVAPEKVNGPEGLTYIKQVIPAEHLNQTRVVDRGLRTGCSQTRQSRPACGVQLLGLAVSFQERPSSRRGTAGETAVELDNYVKSNDAALTDQDGHGTHVAGIIAGMTCLKDKAPGSVAGVDVIKIRINKINDKGLTDTETITRDEAIFGLAPYCKILSLKVLRLSDESDLSNLLAAIGYIRKANDNGRHIKVHGVNLSLGYTLNAEWFAAGQSPLCVEVDRLVRSGVCVVVAAGNAGYGTVASSQGASEQAAHLGTISDPGNAALAITVGSTHRDLPHSYGISYFSGKGPTSDGRMKPDLVAPGERIVSCALVDDESAKNNVAPFRVDSGTSMAAPHVSGAVAAFLSVRGEFKGRPEDVKDILVQAATDLKRRPEFQGGGMLDLMRALQSV